VRFNSVGFSLQACGQRGLGRGVRSIPTHSKSDFSNSVFDRKRGIWFGCLVSNGWFSAAPDDDDVPRAIHTNNPGALNIINCQLSRLDSVGQTKADSRGNITTIYQTPEDGVTAWYYLLSELYGFKTLGYFDLTTLAWKYAGSGASPEEVKAYLDGWSQWSNRTLTLHTVIDLTNRLELLSPAKAEFSYEAAAETPLHDDQILNGLPAHPTKTKSKKARHIAKQRASLERGWPVSSLPNV
jgi:hypothetical protein